MSDSSSENESLNEGSSDEQEVPTDDDGSDVAEVPVPSADGDDTDDEMTVCDDGTYDTDEEPEGQKPDNDKSDDEELDDEVDDDEDVPTPKKTEEKRVKTPQQSKNTIERITNEVNERYTKRKGLQLYLRFPHKLPEEMEEFEKLIKSLSDLIVESHKPRQNTARFCLVDFATTEDRDITLKKLQKTQPETKIFVSLPKTDNEDFIKTIIKKKLQKDYKKREKNILRIESRKAVKDKNYTSIIRVRNIPKSASTAEIKALFPDAVDIQTKPAAIKYEGQIVAIVTLPSTSVAKNNVKRKLELGGNKLYINFNINPKKKKWNKKNKKPAGAGPEQPKKGPIAPTSPVKRSLPENGDTGFTAKKTKVEVNANAGAKNGPHGPCGKGKGKKPFKPNPNKGNPVPNKNQDGKPNMQNKQKKQPQKKGKPFKGVASAAK